MGGDSSCSMKIRSQLLPTREIFSGGDVKSTSSSVDDGRSRINWTPKPETKKQIAAKMRKVALMRCLFRRRLARKPHPKPKRSVNPKRSPTANPRLFKNQVFKMISDGISTNSNPRPNITPWLMMIGSTVWQNALPNRPPRQKIQPT